MTGTYAAPSGCAMLCTMKLGLLRTDERASAL
jgi:hypothetical protein